MPHISFRGCELSNFLSIITFLFFPGTQVRRLVDELIVAHGLRIGVELYAAIIEEIDRSV